MAARSRLTRAPQRVLADLKSARRLGARRVAGELRTRVRSQDRAPEGATTGSAFTIPFPIDLVYTWVDGSDPAWQARRDAAWETANPGEHSTLAANASRYANREELRFSLRSVAANADWVRTIYIVTDRQVPTWLNEAHPQVRVVDHAEIFAAADGVPTFNSHAIESRLHRVPGLGEHYLYLNDDMFFGRPCAAEDFYFGNGIARLFPSPKSIPDGPATSEDTPVLAAGKNNRDLLAGKFGRTVSHRFLHAPYPQLRSVVEEMEGTFAADFARTTLSRFRHPTDISIPASLVGNYAYLTGRAVPGTLTYGYVDLADAKLARRLRRLGAERPQVFCLNDHAGLGADPAAVDQSVREFLRRYFPEPSAFER